MQLASIEGELAGSDLDEVPVQPPSSQRELEIGARDERHVCSGADPVEEAIEALEGTPCGQLVCVVEDELDRRESVELARDRRQDDLGSARGAGRQLCERLRSGWIDPVERPRDRAQKCDRIVVAAVEVDPGHQPLRALTPLAGQSRLSVARRP